MPQQTTLEKPTGELRLLEMLKEAHPKISALAPRPVEHLALIGAVSNAVSKTPSLKRCTNASVFSAVASCYSMGLRIADRVAYLVPYQMHCQLLIDYRGKRDLAVQAGIVKWMKPKLVREHDKIEFDSRDHVINHETTKLLGLSGKLQGVTEEQQGSVVGGYVETMLTDGTMFPHDFMPLWELEKVRNSAKANSKDSPWKTWPERMFLKTLIHRAFNDLPSLDPRMTRSQEVDDALHQGRPVEQPLELDYEVVEGDQAVDPDYVEPPDPGNEEPRRKKNHV